MKFKLRRYYLYYLGRMLAFFVALAPLRIALILGALTGDAAYYLLRIYRSAALENLRSALGGQKTEQEIKRIAKNVFRNLAMNGVELIHLPRLNAGNVGRFIEIKGRAMLDAALEKGLGVIVVTGHFGNWELMPTALKLKGYHGGVIGRRLYFDRYDAFLNRIRKFHGVEVIYRDESPRKALKILKENGILGVVADQDVDSVEGVFVDFLGISAYTPTGPVALARASGAMLIPAFMVRDKARHGLVFEKPIEFADTGDKEKDMIENTKRWSDVVESYIRRYPDHWVWMHRRWKTKKLNTKN